MLVLTCLTFGNFKWLHPDTKLWWRNGFAFLAALASVSLLIHAIYFRVWEFLTPVPSPDGPARLSALHPPKLGLSGDSFSMVLPDGRLWIETYDNYGEWDAPKQGKAQFIGGSNWLAAASGWGTFWPFNRMEVCGSYRRKSFCRKMDGILKPADPLKSVQEQIGWVLPPVGSVAVVFGF